MKKEKIRIYSNPGTHFVNRYIRYNNDKGVPMIKVKEKFDLYADIQTYKDDNDIYKILARVSGDISKLDFNKGVYIDVTKLPDNYNDLMNMNYAIKSDYDSLPIQYKELLGNNFNIFYGLAMTGGVQEFIKNVDNGGNVKEVLDKVNYKFNNTVKEEKSENQVKSEVSENA